MDLSNKNILEVYQNYKYSKYILDNFTNKKELGIFAANQSNPFKYDINDKSGGIKIIDKENNYLINELGFRGEIKKDAEIIALGCSYTFGVGVPEFGVWTDILTQQTGKNILNLGMPGASIKKICETAIAYNSKYKKPKTIFALFPGFFRGMLIEDPDFYFSSRNIDPSKNQEIVKQTSFQSRIHYSRKNNYMFFKNTYNSIFDKSKEKKIRFIENVLSPHQLISDSIGAISTLQNFCYSHNIDFYWSTWDIPTSILMDTLIKIPNFKLKNYIKFAEDDFNNYQTDDSTFPNKICSSNHNSKLTDHACWDRGSDIFVGPNNKSLNLSSHPGIHFHYHVAEIFNI